MRILRDFADCPPDARGAVLALGNFDGVHVGHLAILRDCVALAATEGCRAAAMTFEPHPREFFKKSGGRLRITSFRHKAKLLAAAGVEILFAARFNALLAATSADDFVTRILHEQLGVRHVVTGYNFAFGKGRGGDTVFLTEKAQALGFGFTALPAVAGPAGEAVSSSAIRALLIAGDMEKAAAMLGRRYAIEGRVRRGEGRGRSLGFPTANIAPGPLLIPRLGIYAVRFRVENERAWHAGAASLGVNPTFPLSAPQLEVHGLNMERNLYGKRLYVEFLRFLRDEAAFDSGEALSAQIKQDCAEAERIAHHA